MEIRIQRAQAGLANEMHVVLLAEGLVVAVASVAVVSNAAILNGGLDLQDAVGDGVAGSEAQVFLNLAEGDAVVAPVHVLALMDDLDVGDEFFDEVAKLGDAVVLVVAADVEDLALDDVQGGFQVLEDGLGSIVHVDEGPPLVAAEDGDALVAGGFGGQQVDDQIEAGAGGEAVGGAEAQDDRGEALVVQSQEHTLGADLGAGVEGDGVEGRVLVQDLVAGPVDAAGGGEDEALGADRRGRRCRSR